MPEVSSRAGEEEADAEGVEGEKDDIESCACDEVDEEHWERRIQRILVKLTSMVIDRFHDVALSVGGEEQLYNVDGEQLNAVDEER
jgi:hypothetical protein